MLGLEGDFFDEDDEDDDDDDDREVKEYAAEILLDPEFQSAPGMKVLSKSVLIFMLLAAYASKKIVSCNSRKFLFRRR